MPKWRNELSESVEAVGKTLTLSEKVFGLSILPIFCLFFFFMMNTTRSYPYAFSCISSWVMFSLIGIFIGLTFVIPGFTAFEKMIDPLTTGDSMNPDMVPYVQLSALPTRAVSWVMRAGIGMLLAFTVATGFLYFNIYSDDTREDVAIRWTDKRTHVFRASPKGGHSNVNEGWVGWYFESHRAYQTEKNNIPVHIVVEGEKGWNWDIHVPEGFFKMMDRGLPVRAEVGRGKLGAPWIRHLYLD